jgi:uncharacterized membrane protein YbhN (UPF0104 family)
VIVPFASIADTLRSLADEAGSFFDNLASVRPAPLIAALVVFVAYLCCRAYASYTALRAAYPDVRFPYRRIWGAYVAAFGLNGVVPAGGGNAVQLVLTKASIPGSTYSTVTVALCTVLVFDTVACVAILGYAFTQGAFPKPADFVDLNSFDISFFASHTALTLFVLTLLFMVLLVGYAWLSTRITAFRERTRQGLSVLGQRRQFLLGMCVPQAAAWALRGVSYWLLITAFRLPSSAQLAILVLAIQIIAAIVPFTPGGAGVQQALLVAVFSGTASNEQVAAFSVGQQIALVVCALALGFAAVTLIFRYRSFGALMRDTRATHRAETSAAAAPEALEIRSSG